MRCLAPSSSLSVAPVTGLRKTCSLGRVRRRCPPRSTAVPTMLSAGWNDQPLLHLSPGPMSPRCTTFIITRTLSSLRPAALPGMVDGVSESPGLGCPCSPPHPCPSEPQGGSPNLSRSRAWSLAQACPSLLLEQLPGTLANGGPLSMMQREALPWLAVVRAWDLLATPLTQAGRP